ncbi:MAG TPA: sialidase family protein [Bryobacteraceae bacterium]|nr:sialidase family protein [Bryobacteraceae bacterium]
MEALKSLAFAALLATVSAAQPLHKAELLFPPEHWHNHSSSIVELPNGDFFVSWFHGSGERTADDVKIEGARWRKSSQTWSQRFDLADTPGFPDTNCVVWIDSKKRLWLLWPTILANTWESAIMKYRISTNYQQAEGPPKWDWQDNILLMPKRMQERTQEVLGKDLKDPGPFRDRASRLIALAGDKQFSRLGWFTRTHPIELPNGRIIVPLYSDGFSFGLMAISDDGGASWHASEPIVGYGNIQPSVVRRKNGDLVAYMRDNGPAPKRVMQSVSKDNGETWSPAEDITLPNPGTSVEAIALKDGRWVIAYNDLERGRNSLAISMSEDEGKTWKWTRNMEKGAGRYHYPSLIQASDGTLHLTYSIFTGEQGKEAKSIKHVQFNTAWIEQGDR